MSITTTTQIGCPHRAYTQLDIQIQGHMMPAPGGTVLQPNRGRERVCRSIAYARIGSTQCADKTTHAERHCSCGQSVIEGAAQVWEPAHSSDNLRGYSSKELSRALTWRYLRHIKIAASLVVLPSKLSSLGGSVEK